MRLSDYGCAYCGDPATTRDHVFPSCILEPNSHAMTVPACEKCNREKDKLDLYLRDFLGLRWETQEAPHLKWLAEASLASASKEGAIRPARTMLSTWESICVCSPSGDLKTIAGRIIVDGDRVKAAFQWIVRGLWFFHQKQVLKLDDFQLSAFHGRENRERLKSVWPDYNTETASAVGSSVRYNLLHWQTSPPSGICHIFLYEALFFEANFNENALRTAINSHLMD